MHPDFTKTTIDTLAKRAGYKCSNPDCRVHTVGPNTNKEKVTIIGEAAHIFGARPESKRYNKEMTDKSRAEITNAIWLCRNCHKLIDTDGDKYSATILFKWREVHEEYISTSLGSSTDQIQFQETKKFINRADEFSPLIRRIIFDKPIGWEYLLGAELMRHYNAPLFRKIQDLENGLYFKRPIFLDKGEAFAWISHRIKELQKIIDPISKLIEKLSSSFGLPGEPGDMEEIIHVTQLIRDYLSNVVDLEESIHFTVLPENFERIRELFQNLIGSQASKLHAIPEHLDYVISLIGTDHGGTDENPLVIERTITFELPPNWEQEFVEEMNRLKRLSL